MGGPLRQSASQQQEAAGCALLPILPDHLSPPCPHHCSIRDVQRIGILDIRLFNTDRHAGNMLVRRPRAASATPGTALDGAALLERHQYELVPIDHGFALPEALEPPYFEWQHWPQAMLPFGREELEYIARLDAKADIQMLRQEVCWAWLGGWEVCWVRRRGQCQRSQLLGWAAVAWRVCECKEALVRLPPFWPQH